MVCYSRSADNVAEECSDFAGGSAVVVAPRPFLLEWLLLM